MNAPSASLPAGSAGTTPALPASAPLAVVTGATSGIGVETVRQLAERGWRVALTARTADKGFAARDRILARVPGAELDVFVGDLSSQTEVRRLAAALLARHERIDALINNAGVYLGRRRLTVDGIEETFAVNHLAPFLLTHMLLPALRRAPRARIVTVSSMAHWYGALRLETVAVPDRYLAIDAYAQSKLANILFTRELARRLAGGSVTATCLHPGVIPTDLGGDQPLTLFAAMYRTFRPFLINDARGADTSVWLASAPEAARLHGVYVVRRRVRAGAPWSRSARLRDGLWELSESLTGIRFDAGREEGAGVHITGADMHPGMTGEGGGATAATQPAGPDRLRIASHA